MNRVDLRSFNWLVMYINNRALARCRHLMRGRVVDLGCGACPYKADILKTATEYVGVDWPSSQHDQSQVDVFADLSGRLPFDDGYADTVVSFQVMEHLPEPASFLSESARILKPGGHLIITVPFMWHVHESPHDYFRYTRYGLTYLLEKAAFSEIAVTENTGFWQTTILKANYHSLRFARGPRRYLWMPFWLLGQLAAPILDRLDFDADEPASYTVTARKPLPPQPPAP